MSDAKERYSDGVYTRKIETMANQDLTNKIAGGIARANTYKHEWKSVNINDVVDKFAPNSEPEYIDGKIYFYNSNKTIAVVTDVGGGYLRIQDLTLNQKRPLYLNLDGTNGHNYKDSKGKIHGRNNSEYNKATHFRIKKREEM